MNHTISLAFCALLGISLALPLATQAETTRIVFAKGSYCGSYTGDFSGGKRFVLGLGRDQTFISRNTGNSRQFDVYVTGPTGKIPGQNVAANEIHYRTTARGDYEIMVLSESAFSSVEFCAY
jgi:hypothetical protein